MFRPNLAIIRLHKKGIRDFRISELTVHSYWFKVVTIHLKVSKKAVLSSSTHTNARTHTQRHNKLKGLDREVGSFNL